MKIWPFIIAILLVGCGKSAPSLSGKWNMVMGPTTMQIQFGNDGKYTGTMMGAEVNGTYSVKGNILEMQPPTMVGPNGSVTPPGGAIRAKMISEGPDSIRLEAGTQTFTLTHVNP